MPGRNSRPSRPPLPATGKGWRICNASGAVGLASDVVVDVRQGPVLRRYADITPGFGTWHPQDLKQFNDLADPSPICNGNSGSEPVSAADMGISDQERRAALVEGRAPRGGY